MLITIYIYIYTSRSVLLFARDISLRGALGLSQWKHERRAFTAFLRLGWWGALRGGLRSNGGGRCRLHSVLIVSNPGDPLLTPTAPLILLAASLLPSPFSSIPPSHPSYRCSPLIPPSLLLFPSILYIYIYIRWKVGWQRRTGLRATLYSLCLEF